uniref:TyrR/PhhR family helix-turn-helix DNA-binding protein n=1 Tax=Microbulbifer agarilyticus TaxID=260552 RepID=UPI0005258104|nr:TyrR/PhhR family helix-turn-helix DNA-binding protein [Microbulbifer agarilyticus]
MAIFADFRVNVRTGEIGGDSGDKVYLWAPGLLLAQFQSIEKSLQQVPGVQRVRRIALIPSERRHFELDTLLRHVSYPVLSVDSAGRIIAANLAAARAFGVNEGQVPGMQLQRFLPKLQLEELLRGLTAPRYGFPVSVRGKSYTLDWSPITVDDSSAGPASLAGAVLTLHAAAPDKDALPERLPPTPQVLWDLDARRACCLRLQEMAPLHAPLLVSGERGSGKTTFLQAAYYLCPLAEGGEVYRCRGELLDTDGMHRLAALPADTVVLLDDLDLAPADVQRQLAESLLRTRFGPRLMVTVTVVSTLLPVLQQCFASQHIQLPTLRTMRPSLERFVRLILSQVAPGEGLPEFSDLGDQEGAERFHEVVDLLKRSDWPTNFTGLAQQIESALAHMRARGGSVLASEDFPEAVSATVLPWHEWGKGLTLAEQLEKVERSILAELLESLPPAQRSSRALARPLGISHTAVANKLRKYKLLAH